MAGRFALAGIIGGVFWIGLAFFPPVGTQQTREYEVLWNRLWTPALVCMLLGFIGMFRVLRAALSQPGRFAVVALLAGLVLMIVGNFTEYWILSDLPHEGPDGYIRGLVWMTFLSGYFVVLVAAAVTGATVMGHADIPRWLSLMFVLTLPLTIAVGFVSLNWAGTPMGVLSIIVGSLIRSRGAVRGRRRESRAAPTCAPDE